LLTNVDPASAQCPTGTTGNVADAVSAKNVALQPGATYALSNILCFTPLEFSIPGLQLTLIWVGGVINLPSGEQHFTVFGTCLNPPCGASWDSATITIPQDASSVFTLSGGVGAQWKELPCPPPLPAIGFCWDGRGTPTTFSWAVESQSTSVAFSGDTDCEARDGGFDATINPPTASVTVGSLSTTPKVHISGSPENVNAVSFRSANPAIMTAEALTSAGPARRLKLTGVFPGETTVEAVLAGSVIGSLSVVVYPRQQLNVAAFIVDAGTKKKVTCVSTPDIDEKDEKVLETALNNIWDQAGIEFKVTKLRREAIEWDVDGSCSLNLFSLGELYIPGPEVSMIRDSQHLKDPKAHTVIYFVRDVEGLSGFATKFGTIAAVLDGLYAMVGNRSGQASTTTTAAHEVGHNLGLKDVPSDNLMNPNGNSASCLLTKEQWEKANNTADLVRRGARN
jgi:hypothetical protein